MLAGKIRVQSFRIMLNAAQDCIPTKGPQSSQRNVPWMTFEPEAVLRKRLVVGLAVATLLLMPFWLPVLWRAATMPLDTARIGEITASMGIAGPLVIVGLVVAAIVVSPIPSGPIAIAAGALYGTVWGGVLVVAGAQIGAMIAFCATRYLGYDALRRSNSPVLRFVTAPHSQYALMGIVFVSRLIPFISFDVISYAAGVTSLSFWRFAVATLAGVGPIGFGLSALGSGMIGASANWLPVILVTGSITLLPPAVYWVWHRFRR